MGNGGDQASSSYDDLARAHVDDKRTAPEARLQTVRDQSTECDVSGHEKLKKIAEKGELSSSQWDHGQVTIFRVPDTIRRFNAHACTPRHVSIGPLHRGRLSKTVDSHKARSFSQVLRRTRLDPCLLYERIRAMEKRARSCYEDPLLLSSEEFVECMLLDGCFVLEILQGYQKGYTKLGYSEHDPIFSSTGASRIVRQDMLLLENQIPHFILNSLFALQLRYDPQFRDDVAPLVKNFFDGVEPSGKFGWRRLRTEDFKEKLQQQLISSRTRSSSSTQALKTFMIAMPSATAEDDIEANPVTPSNKDAAINKTPFKDSFFPTSPKNKKIAISKPLTRASKDLTTTTTRSSVTTSESLYPPAYFHFLDIIHKHLMVVEPKSEKRRSKTDQQQQHQQIRCVTKLRDAGIQFKCRHSNRIWDIKFENGVLEIPRLLIRYQTKPLFLNLMAFERCHINTGSNHITAYAIFMDNLIDSKEDVEHLRDCGIIDHWLGSDEEAAEWFNTLRRGVMVDESYLSDLSMKVNEHYEHRWNSWWLSFKEDYLTSPWSLLSLLAAIVLLLLTGLQTFYAVFGYHKPSN